MIEPVLNLIQYGLIGLVSFLVIGWLGFRIPARAKKPGLLTDTSTIPLEPIPVGLPEPVMHFLETLYPEGLPSASSIVAWGHGRITSHLRIFGSVWLPLSWTLFLKPGDAYLWRVNITWFMRAFLRGGDLYTDEHGLYKMGNDVLESEFIDMSEFTILWIYTIIFAPFTLANYPNLKWQRINEHTVWLTVPGPNQSINNFKLIFDSYGMLHKIETKRAASRDGALLDFSTTIDQILAERGEKSPRLKFKNAWESVVYIDIDSSGFCFNSDVESQFQIGI